MTSYETYVKDKNVEQILEAGQTADSNSAPYLQVAAQVRSQQDLIQALKEASATSTRMARQLVVVTIVLGLVGISQVIATAWPYVSWWWMHR